MPMPRHHPIFRIIVINIVKNTTRKIKRHYL
jgi:hypothetical protein